MTAGQEAVKVEVDGALERLYRSSNLTRRQLRAWLGHRARPAATLWNLAVRMPIEGRLDPERWAKSFACLVAASDALRSRFVEQDGIPQRVVDSAHAVQVARADLSGAADPAAAARAWIEARTARPLPLEGPLYSAAILQLGPERWEWFLLQDHLISDGISLMVIARALAELYASPPATERLDLPALPLFADFAAAEHEFCGSPRCAADRAFWENLVASPRARGAWDGQSKDPERLEIRQREHVLEPERHAALAALAAAPGGPGLPSLFFAAFAAWVAGHCGGAAPLLTTAVHNRRRPAFKSTLGLLMDVVPVQPAPPGEQSRTFSEQAAGLQRRVLASLRHEPAALPAFPLEAQAFMFNYHLEHFRCEGGGIRAVQQWIPPREGIELLALQVLDNGAEGRLHLEFHLDAKVFAGREDETVADFLHFLDRCASGDPGSRLEPVLRRLPGVTDFRLRRALRADGGFTLRLEAASQEDMTPLHLRRLLLEHLGPADLPDEIVLVDRCLTTAEPPAAASPERAPAGASELLIAEIWREILKLDAVTAADRFIARGGDSLQAVLAASLLEARSGVRLRPEEFFVRNLEQIARILDAQRAAAGAP